MSRLQIKKRLPEGDKSNVKAVKKCYLPSSKVDALRWPLVPRSFDNKCGCGKVDQREHHLHLLFLRSYLWSTLFRSVIWRENVYASAEKRDDNARCLLANEAGMACLVAISAKIENAMAHYRVAAKR